MPAPDDVIKQWVRTVEKSGELTSNPYFGKPFDFDDGFFNTPARYRMAHKVLRNAGYSPPEVALFNEAADLKEALKNAPTETEAAELRRQLAEKNQQISVMMETLKKS